MTDSILIDDLRRHLLKIQDDKASISPAIYDTGMLLRCAPPSDPAAALRWLLNQQASDGGWSFNEADFRARTVPTLSAVLALYHWRKEYKLSSALDAGLSWLRQSAKQWDEIIPDDIPVGLELLLPRLLQDAVQLGLELPLQAYRAVDALGTFRRKSISKIPANILLYTTAIHSWEAWGELAPDDLFRSEHGVGCSPAATALWLHRKQQNQNQAYYSKSNGGLAVRQCRIEEAEAIQYLKRATQATGIDIEGVVPTAFPITRFIHAYSLHTLTQTNLLLLPALTDIVQPLLKQLKAALTEQGVGFADGFIPDCDDTSAAIGTLLHAGMNVSIQPILDFALDSHFASYRGELQPSLIATARAIQVLDSVNGDTHVYRKWIQQRQGEDGAWLSDKWNSLWIYSTWQAILSLRNDPTALESLNLAQQKLLQSQYSNGSWGATSSTAEATACAILALASLPRQSAAIHEAIQRGRAYLLDRYHAHAIGNEPYWMAKEQYIPYNLRHIIILAALLSTDSTL